MILLRRVFSPLIFLYNVIYVLISSLLNGRALWKVVLHFALNFSLVFTWLLIFKNAGLIPNEWRPTIHVKLLPYVEDFTYNYKRFSAWLSMLFWGLLGYLVYKYFYSQHLDSSSPIYSSFPKTTTVFNNPIPDDEEANKTELQDLTFDINSDEDDRSDSASSSSPNPYNEAQQSSITVRESPPTLITNNKFRLAPPVLLLASWFILNFDYAVSIDKYTPLDIFSWFLYVLCHFFAPLFTLIWLYVFHNPGALKWFGLCLGTQNICGVITHLLFPNASPWFVHMKGIELELNYDMLGYAAGLVRVDVAMGTHLNSNGFHKSPIVFGAFPSLHSAMAVLVFLTVCFYARWTALKVLAGLFVVCQWWATIYLDHHWRIDLLGGLCYSVFFFTIYQKKMLQYERDFLRLRAAGNFQHSSTMGMRVFKNTLIRNFFDPYYS